MKKLDLKNFMNKTRGYNGKNVDRWTGGQVDRWTG